MTPHEQIFAAPRVSLETRPDGSMIMESPQPLGAFHASLGEMLRNWAAEAPDRTFLAERAGDGWRTLTYRETLDAVERIAQALLVRGLSRDRPVMILSGNSINTALLQLAAMHVGIPVAPVSPAYSLMSRDFAKLHYIYDLLTPGLLYVESRQPFANAIQAVNHLGSEVVIGDDDDASGATAFRDLQRETPGGDVARAFAEVGPDTVAKILFTSGSTGAPKGVINTQRMMCSNQQALARVWPFLEQQPPVLLDWLPWNHTFGGNHNFNMILRNGGTLYLDDGKPVPGQVEKTVENLREISPDMYFNVPGGYQALLPFLEEDDALRDRFFSRLKLIFYAGAALPQTLWDRLEQLSQASLGYKVPMVSSWGSTETAPLVTAVLHPIDKAGVIGIPVPGCRIKLVPNMGKLELRVSGPNVTPGYWKNPEKTREAFDDEGYYRIGDAGRLEDPDRPEIGIRFDGRIAENFKLISGTWVHVGALRMKVIEACAPVVQDAVITGHDRDEIGVLLFPNENGCRRIMGGGADDQSREALIRDPAVIDRVVQGLRQHNTDNPGSSTRVTRALILDTPPSMDAGEITDKGYINQARVLDCRETQVDALYAGGPDVLRIPGGNAS